MEFKNKTKRQIILVAMLIFCLSVFSYAEYEKIIVTLSPKPKYICGPWIFGSDGNIYVGGKLVDGTEGILRIQSDGTTTRINSMHVPNLCRDINGDYLYVEERINPPAYDIAKISKISIATGNIIDEVIVTPTPELGIHPPAVASDGNFYILGVLNGTRGILKIQPNGSLSLFMSNDASTISVDSTGDCLILASNGYVTKVSIDNATIVSVFTMSPYPNSIHDSPVAVADGNLYSILTLNGIKGIYKIQPDGSVSLFDQINTEYMVGIYLSPDIDGKNLFAITITSSSYSGTIAKDRISRYAATDISGDTTVKLVKYKISTANYSNVRAYPNPFKSSKGHQWIRFDGLVAATKLQIFNLAGEKVFEEDDINLGGYTWDVRNNEGDDVVSGLYICLTTDNKGNKGIVKIAVIR